MNAHEASTSVFTSDRDVIAEIERILPQPLVDSLKERILQDRVYDPAHAEAFSLLKEAFRKIGFRVNRKTLATKLRDFQRALERFDDELISNFAYEPHQKLYAVHPSRRNGVALMRELRQSYDLFAKTYRLLLSEATTAFHSSVVEESVELQNLTIRFSNEEGAIYVGESRCQLPPFKNGHYLCRVMFTKPPKVPVDWSDVANEMFGKDPIRRAERLRLERKVRDAMYAVNRIVGKLNTPDKLFTWKDKTIIRNYGR